MQLEMISCILVGAVFTKSRQACDDKQTKTKRQTDHGAVTMQTGCWKWIERVLQLNAFAVKFLISIRVWVFEIGVDSCT